MKKDKLLWVDDEISLLRPHILFLEGKGYEVDTVTNGQDALDRCRATTYDLIFLDENMPGLSGLQTLALIKDICPTVPVVMITKSEEENIMDMAIGQKNCRLPDQARQSQSNIIIAKEEPASPGYCQRSRTNRLSAELW